VAEGRTRTLRLFVGLALLMAALAETQTMLQALRSEKRLRVRTEALVCTRLEEAWPFLLPLLESGSSDGWNAAFDRVEHSGLAREVEVLDVAGVRLSARPSVPPGVHNIKAPERQQILEGRPLCVAVESSAGLRIAAYSAFPPGSPDRILRLWADAGDLEADSNERGISVVVHQVALGLLVTAGLISLWPTRPAQDAPSSALDAYERAMEKLRDHEAILRSRHAAERDRMSAALREREAFSRAGEITAQIVHEVRNGLGTILGYARLLEREEEAVAARARVIRAECETLEATVRRFVELVRDERPNLAAFDSTRMLRRVVEREARIRDAPVPTLVAPETLPLLVGDESLLERAFENLVRNAIEAAGNRGLVSVTAGVEACTLVVTVLDDGPGLSGEVPTGILTSSKPGGLGVGLALARKIITLHDGMLNLLPRVPRGVEAVVALPLAGPNARAAAGEECYYRKRFGDRRNEGA